MLLERSKSKSYGNIGEESKFGPSNEVQFVGMKSRSIAKSIDFEAHQGDVVGRRKKKLTEKWGDFSWMNLRKNGQICTGRWQERPTQ